VFTPEWRCEMGRFAAVAASVLLLTAATAVAQEKDKPAPLETFVKTFTDLRATSAQKELLLPEGAWYEGTITVSDVEYQKPEGKDAAWAEIMDWNFLGGCYQLQFRTQDTAGALRRRVGEPAVVRARLREFGSHEGKFVSNCNARIGLFTETEIVSVGMPSN
jgi:hypothetical protein